MGRELKRKQAKKEGKNLKELQTKQEINNKMEPKSLLIILGVLVVFCIIIYFLTSIFITKDFNTSKETNEEATITNKILASDSLRQAEEVYYVYYYDKTNEDSSISSIVSSLEEKVYRVDLHDDFNTNYIGEVNKNAKTIEELKVKDPTVIKVESEEIVAFYSGTEEIKIGLK